MTSIKVQGTLRSPLNTPLYPATIRLTAIDTVGDTPTLAEAIHTTQPDGTYLFDLAYGYYQLEVNSTDEYSYIANVIVDSVTPNEITIAELTQYSTPVIPPVVIPEDANWESLHVALRNDLNTSERVKIDQLSDLSTYENETKRLLQNSLIGADMSEETVSTNVGSTLITDQTNVYEDSVLNQSIQQTTTGTTRGTSLRKGTEQYESSNGNGQIIETISYDVGLATSVFRNELTNTTLSLTDSHSVDSASVDRVLSITPTVMDKTDSTTFNVGNITATASEGVLFEYGYLDTDNIPLTDKPKMFIGKELTFIDDIHNFSFKDVLVSRVDANDTLQTTYTQEITAYERTTKHTITNDGFHAKQEYVADEVSYVGTDGQELLKVDMVNNEVTVKGKLNVTNPDDFKGEPGIVRYYVYQYAETDSPNDVDWYDVYNASLHKWRRQAEVTGTAENPITGSWSEGFLLNAKDGLPGDTLYVEYQYAHVSVPSSQDWHETMHDNDIWRRERTIKNGSPTSSWSSASRIRGFDGPEGSITDREYQYAVKAIESPTNTFHYNFVTGDHFRRERVVVYANQADYDAEPPIPLTVGPWLNVTQIVPIKGVDYGYKQTTIYLYQKATSTPAAPTGDMTYDFTTLLLSPQANRGDWTQEVPGGVGDLYVAVAVATALGDVSEEIAPADWNIALWATAGSNSATPYLYQRGTSLPSSPATNTFSFADRSFQNPVAPWEYTIPSGTDTLYVAIAQAYSINPTDVIYTNEWQVGEFGTTGLNQANVNIFQRSATQPAKPTVNATYIFSNGDVTNLNGGWYSNIADVPQSSNPMYIGIASAISLDSTDTILPSEWDVAKYSEDGMSSAVVTMYMTGSAPSTFPGNATYNYITGILTIPEGTNNGWEQHPPFNSSGKIWVTQVALVAPVGVTTELITSNRWATATLFVEDGYKSHEVNLYMTTDHTVPAVTRNSTDVTYNFNTNTTTGMSAPWSPTIPASQGKVWIQRGIARTIVTSATDVIPHEEFAAPELLVMDGKTQDLVNLFVISVGVPTIDWTAVTHNIEDNTYIFTGDNSVGWQPTVPDNTSEGGRVWYITNVKVTSDNTLNVVHYASAFSTPSVYVQNGTKGADGANGYIIRSFWKTNPIGVPPTAPTGTNLALGTGTLNGFSEDYPTSLPTGHVVWVSSTYAEDETTNTGTGYWTNVGQSSGTPGQDGQDGDAGTDGAWVSYIYRSYSGTPPTPSGGSFNGTTETIPTSWSDSPVFVVGQETYVSTNRYTQAANGTWSLVGAWTSPTVFIKEGTDGEDGIDGTDGAWVSYVYRSETTPPSAPSGGTFDGTNEGIPTGWTDDPSFTIGKVTYISKNRYVQASNGTWSQVGTWSTPTAFIRAGEDGKDGASGAWISYVYKSATTTPTAPSGGTYNGSTETFPSGWTDDPVYVSGETTYVSANRYVQDINGNWSLVGAWSTPTLFIREGEDGLDGLTLRGVYKNSTSAPSKPTGTAIPPTDWTLSPSAPAANQYTYTCYTYSVGATATVGNGVWTSVIQMSGNNGTPGNHGNHGQGSFRKSYNGNPGSLSTASIDADVAAIANRAAQEGDLINYYWTGATGVAKYSRYFFRGASSWTEATFVVSGSAVIENTLAAKAIRSGDVFTQKLHVGTTDTTKSQVTISGNGDGTSSNGRIWAGHTNYTNAPFRVDRYGNMVATSATVTGAITCTSLSAASNVDIGPSSGARLKLTDNRIDVYDASNNLKVRIGNLG